jgi:glycosyltransferase 2 family protein
MKLALRLLLAAAGLVLFGWFVQRAGVGEIARAFTNLGWLAPIALLPFALVYLIDTLGWRFAFGKEGVPGVGFATLVHIRWAGESINAILPSAYIGGEAAKVQLLHKRGVPRMHSASSVVAGKTAQFVAQVAFIATGSIAGAANLPSESSARAGMVAITALATVIVALLFWLQRRGMFRTLAAVLPVRALTSRAESLRQLDERIFEFYRKDRRHFVFSAIAYFCGWVADSLEILLVSHLLGMPIDLSQAVAVEAFVGVAKGLGIFVPGALGVQESGIVFLCLLFGMPPAFGVAYAIIRRGRDVVYAAIGGVLLYAEGFSFRKPMVAASGGPPP